MPNINLSSQKTDTSWKYSILFCRREIPLIFFWRVCGFFSLHIKCASVIYLLKGRATESGQQQQQQSRRRNYHFSEFFNFIKSSISLLHIQSVILSLRSYNFTVSVCELILALLITTPNHCNECFEVLLLIRKPMI